VSLENNKKEASRTNYPIKEVTVSLSLQGYLVLHGTFQFPNERKNYLEDKHEPACTVRLHTIMTHNCQTKGKTIWQKEKDINLPTNHLKPNDTTTTTNDNMSVPCSSTISLTNCATNRN
jgi:hypothetical protein